MEDFSAQSIHDSLKASTNEGGENELVFAKEEDTAVSYLRVLTFLSLVAVAVAVCLIVYFEAVKAEQETFENDFADIGEKLVTSFEASLNRRLGMLESLALATTSYVNDPDTNASFPFFTVRDFEMRASNIAQVADLMSLVVNVKVEGREKEAWEKYAQENQGWRAEGIALREGVSVEQVEHLPIHEKIMRFKAGNNGKEVEDGPGPYFVNWQFYPAINMQVPMNNQYDRPGYGQYIRIMEEKKGPVLPASYDFWDPEGAGKHDHRRGVFNRFMEVYERWGGAKFEDDACITIFYPIFDRLGAGKQIKGMIMSGVYWRTYFLGQLLPGTNGITTVLSNDCGQDYTYEINGADAKFVGLGDLHDPAYNHLGVSSDIASALSTSNGTAVYGCKYWVTAYPSKEPEESYMTSTPVNYVLVLAAVFLCTSAVFVLYDYCVAKRQEKVLRSAMQSGKLVSNLFPEDVRQRLYEEQEKNNKTNEDKANFHRMDSSLGGDEAIAQSHPNCTILFADIAGFTKWSSSRTPAEVFQLLETLYGAFDEISRRRKVFKVETIGDCYVAATGLPRPQRHHAIIMAKFANDCLGKLGELMREDLVDRLGEDTASLGIRIGLHSGPVTAGVLRGDKGRYQIFGDTVNVSARMESNGAQNRIHVSETTARLLESGGKGSWLTAREELVEAKGKGKMQTYWVSSTAGTAASTASLPSMDGSDFA